MWFLVHKAINPMVKNYNFSVERKIFKGFSLFVTSESGKQWYVVLKCIRSHKHLCYGIKFQLSFVIIPINPLTPGPFCQNHIFWTFWRFSGWIWAKLAPIYSKRHYFATWQHAFLSTSMAFYYIFARACAEIKILRFGFWTRKWPTSLGFSILLYFFRLSFFAFSFLFAAVIDLLLGLLPLQKILRKHHRDTQFLPWSSHA